MKKILSMLLAGTVVLGLGPARAAEGSGFSDVAEGDWFAPYVEVCVERGLMQGTGEGRFSPEAELSDPECLTLALRLYDLQRGGDGSIEKTPEELGRMVLTLADGTRLAGYRGEDRAPFWSWSWDGAGSVLVEPPGETGEEKRAWTLEHEGPATLEAAGECWRGEASYYETPTHFPVLRFLPGEEDREAMKDAIIQGRLYDDLPGADKWWRDAFYAWEQMEEGPVKEALDPLRAAGSTRREQFAAALAAAAGELEQINEVSALPDCSDEGILGLYRAGILTGFDPSGTFHGQAGLTRGEAAAMLARALEPSLRLGFSPSPLPTGGYTLTYLRDGVPDCGVEYPVCILGNEKEEERGILTLEGEFLPWPEGEIAHMDQAGAWARFHIYLDREKDPYATTVGMMDARGEWTVAPGTYCEALPAEDGIWAWSGSWPEFHGWRLDETGQVAEDLGVFQNIEPPGGYENYEEPDLRSWDGLTVHSHGVAGGVYYVSFDDTAASGLFDWAGPIGPDGRGFVGVEGEIYRIEFEK